MFVPDTLKRALKNIVPATITNVFKSKNLEEDLACIEEFEKLRRESRNMIQDCIH